MLEEVEEKIEELNLSVSVKSKCKTTLQVLSRIKDKKQMQAALEVVSASKFNEEVFTEEETIRLINNHHPGNIRKLLCYSHLSKEKVLMYADIIDKVEEESVASSLIDIMGCSRLNETDYIMSAIELIKAYQEEYQRHSSRNILINKNAIKLEIAYPLAAKVGQSDQEYKATKINELVHALNDKNKQNLLLAADLINKTATEEKAELLKTIATSPKIEEENITTALLSIASFATEEYQLKDIQDLMMTKDDSLLVLIGSKMITNSGTKESSKRIKELTKTTSLDDILPYLGKDLNIYEAFQTKIATEQEKYVKIKTI